MDTEVLEALHIPLADFVTIDDPRVLDSFQFVMGFSDNHFSKNHALSTIASVFPNKSVYVYNLGLSKEHLEEVSLGYLPQNRVNFACWDNFGGNSSKLILGHTTQKLGKSI